VPLGEGVPLKRGRQRRVPLKSLIAAIGFSSVIMQLQIGIGGFRGAAALPSIGPSGYFTAVGSTSVKTVADMHKHAAYHNKHK